MSKPLKTIAIIAGVVVLAAALAPVFGIAAPFASWATIAAVASAVSAGASMGAAALQKPPDMKGTISQVMIGANMPIIYALGLSYIGGGLIYDKSSDGADNDERTQMFVYSAAGPIDSFQSFLADYTPITFSATSGGIIQGTAVGFYDDFMWANSRLGARPDTALSAVTGMTGALAEWGSAYKLSGYACAMVSMEFDEDGKRYASGIPQYGMIGKWVKIYDPRLDSTYPGGSGSHDWDDESTWAWSENPGLHALTYARGRFMNDIKIVGPGIAKESIDIPAFVELANICDANDWTCGGAVYEGPGLSKWDNLKRILQAAAAEPVWVGGVLTVKASAPKISLDTITGDDLASDDVEVRAMGNWKDRQNSIVPRYRSPDHKWEYVQADAVTNTTYVTEDGELKTDEVQFDLVQEVTQAAELAAYTLVNRREFGPIRLSVKPRLILYRPGDALTVNIPEAGLTNELCVIIARSVDPATGSIQLTLESETTAKHAYALGQTGTAPPTPTIVDPEDVDTIIADNSLTTAQITQLISSSYTTGLTFTLDSAGDVVVSTHDRVYSDKVVSVTGDTVLTAAVPGDLVLIYYDDADRAGGAVTYAALVVAGGVGETDSAFASSANPYRHFVAVKEVPAAGSSGGGSGAGSGGGGSMPGGGGGLVNYY